MTCLNYADDSSVVKVIKNKENWIAADKEIIAELNGGVECGTLILNLLNVTHCVYR